jgi:hypothetical protein
VKDIAFWSDLPENRNARFSQVISELASLAIPSISLEQYAQKAVDLVAGELELYFVGLYLIDSMREWAILKAGTGEFGPTLLQRGLRFSLSGVSLVSEAINHQAICVTGGGPIMGFFYSVLPTDMQVEPIPPFQFVEMPIGCPLLPETRLEVTVPLGTRSGIIGVLEFHRRLYMDRDGFSLLLQVSDRIASVCAGILENS